MVRMSTFQFSISKNAALLNICLQHKNIRLIPLCISQPLQLPECYKSRTNYTTVTLHKTLRVKY